MVLASFEEAHEQANGNVFTPVLEVMEKAAVESFFTGRAGKLRDGKMYNLAGFQISHNVSSANS